MTGYSETPLAKKLGIKEGFRVGLVNSPEDFQKQLASLPAKVKISVADLRKPLDLIILFTDSQRTLRIEFPILAEKLTVNGMLWIAWPKRVRVFQPTYLSTPFNRRVYKPVWLT